MKLSMLARGIIMGVGIVALQPLNTKGDVARDIHVYASDTTMSSSPPPNTTATWAGSETLAYGSNDMVTFSGLFTPGVYTLEVESAAAGYVPRPSLTDPNAINDPDSEYGNPRNVTIEEELGVIPLRFRFDPVFEVAAEVRDAWTMERIEGASISFTLAGPSGPIVVDRYPHSATYAVPWVTDAEGAFPSNIIINLWDSFDLEVTADGYEPHSIDNVISNPAPGDLFDLATLYLAPVDLNTNQIADAWEESYFGVGANVVPGDDADLDGVSNLDEYISGTDPTNWFNCLWIEMTTHSNQIDFVWDAEKDRTYCVQGTTNLVSGEWLQVGGPWETTNGQLEMSWSETNMALSWNSSYRVEVVPTWWSGTNHVLINTNRPAPPTGGVTSTNGPPLPGGN